MSAAQLAASQIQDASVWHAQVQSVLQPSLCIGYRAMALQKCPQGSVTGEQFYVDFERHFVACRGSFGLCTFVVKLGLISVTLAHVCIPEPAIHRVVL